MPASRTASRASRRSSRAPRRVVDVAVFALALFQMLKLSVPDRVHGWAGVALLVLLVVHVVQHRRWFVALVRGHWNALRVVRAVAVFATLAALVAALASGLVMAPFFGAHGTGAARAVHLPATHLAYCLLALHAGLQLAPSSRRRGGRRGGARVVAVIVCAAVAAAGIWAFVCLRFPAYIAGTVGFAFMSGETPIALTILEYLLVSGLFAVVGFAIAALCRRGKRP